jgi:PBP1b-binding outer membrane lipoprotein LpoB
MANQIANPVIPEEVATTISNTFLSVTPHLPVNMQGPQDLARSKSDLDDDKSKDESDRSKIRIALNKRENKLLERMAEGGFLDFGQIVTHNIVADTRNVMLKLTNYKKQCITMNVNKFTLNTVTDLQKAIIIAENSGTNLYLYTSAYGSYKNSEWFDTVYVTFK